MTEIFQISHEYIDELCKQGNVELLENIKNTGYFDNDEKYNVTYSYNAIFWASVNEHINVLEWWKKEWRNNSNLILKYDWFPVDHALKQITLKC